jgi:aminoglycoside phosphotransferase family enzyme
VVTEDQTEVVAFLESAITHGGNPVARIDTHASIVFLAGERAWKLKRAVRYDYLDFSTVERRRAMCEAEVLVNRRTAPTLYRGVVPVTREPKGRLALGGQGAAVEWLVEMIRFDQEGLLDRLAARDALDLGLMRPLASAIVRFHRAAERRHDHGGKAGMSWVVDGNAAGLAEFGGGVLDPALCNDLAQKSRAAVDCRGPLLDRRRDAGFVRQCHGDLHLRNIVLVHGEPTLFDAIEFNNEIACIDVFYDLAILPDGFLASGAHGARDPLRMDTGPCAGGGLSRNSSSCWRASPRAHLMGTFGEAISPAGFNRCSATARSPRSSGRSKRDTGTAGAQTS